MDVYRADCSRILKSFSSPGFCGWVTSVTFLLPLGDTMTKSTYRKKCLFGLTEGGHTAEILRLVGSLSGAYSPRHYVIAESDEMSAKKIHSLELARAQNDSTTEHTEYYLHRIPRSREVRQSWLSSVFTTLYSIWFSFPLVHRIKPDLVLCNGPGTCVPICVSALLLGILGIKKVIIVYVESICRVETLSLSGKILWHLSDYFIVQWPTLKEKYPKSVYLGRIV
uniref:UDP-N-acetylglucosamine transferase subunit ALG14 n=1 Tax=Rattus norvegicus TaxID=10116 RepID=A0ABK0M356_RAT